MVNKAILIGRLTADPEVKASSKGIFIANIRLATNTFAGKDENGKAKEHTDFHSVVCFGKSAELAGQYLRKGRLIYVEGHIQTRSWTDGEGKKRYATEIVVDDFKMLSPKDEVSAAA